jgi:GNAT superfamily N-acetyltransferase
MRNKIFSQAIFCAILSNEIIGTIALENDFVVGFYTKVEHLNQGVGRLLMEFIEKYAQKNKLKEIRLAASPAALTFYYKNGWTKVEDIIANYGGVAFNETLMSKKIEKSETA